MVELTQETNIMAIFIKLEASHTIPPPNPSLDEILIQVTVGDEDARKLSCFAIAV